MGTLTEAGEELWRDGAREKQKPFLIQLVITQTLILGKEKFSPVINGSKIVAWPSRGKYRGNKVGPSIDP